MASVAIVPVAAHYLQDSKTDVLGLLLNDFCCVPSLHHIIGIEALTTRAVGVAMSMQRGWQGSVYRDDYRATTVGVRSPSPASGPGCSEHDEARRIISLAHLGPASASTRSTVMSDFTSDGKSMASRVKLHLTSRNRRNNQLTRSRDI